jgi:hypothetical protein
MNPQNAFLLLHEHYKAKHVIERAYWLNLAETGKKAHHKRINRIPFYEAVLFLSADYAAANPDFVASREYAFRLLCSHAKYDTNMDNPFEALCVLHMVTRLPPEKAEAYLTEGRKQSRARYDAIEKKRQAEREAHLAKLEEDWAALRIPTPW